MLWAAQGPPMALGAAQGPPMALGAAQGPAGHTAPSFVRTNVRHRWFEPTRLVVCSNQRPNVLGATGFGGFVVTRFACAARNTFCAVGATDDGDDRNTFLCALSRVGQYAPRATTGHIIRKRFWIFAFLVFLLSFLVKLLIYKEEDKNRH